jgi:dihydrofolate reductase
MLPEAHVFIATSLDGYIAEPDGGIGWLTGLAVPEGEDHGYAAFMAGVDGVLMGRATWDKVLTFGDWPFTVPVTVLSRTLPQGVLRSDLPGGVTARGDGPRAALEAMAAAGARRVYVDGGQTVTAALHEGLVSRLTVTRVPVLLGAGLPLFGACGAHGLHHVETRVRAHGFVQSVYDLPRG